MGNAHKPFRSSRAGHTGGSLAAAASTASDVARLARSAVVLVQVGAAAWGWVNRDGRAVRVARAVLNLPPRNES